MLSNNFEAAREKARVKQAILTQLETLPRAAQEDVLADIVLGYEDEQPEATTIRPPSLARRGARGAAGKRKGVRENRPTRGRPRGEAGSKTSLVEEALRAKPRTPIGELAKAIYPGEENASHRIRAILWSLKRQGRANNAAPGEWEIT
jgi:hypothetical protein